MAPGSFSGPRSFLGFHAFLYDSAAALIVDGGVVSAVAEERLDRRKHSGAFPENAVRSCLDQAGMGVGDLHGIAFGFRPWRHMTRRLRSVGAGLPASLAFGTSRGGAWARMMTARAAFISRLGGARVPFTHHLHHRCHAATAFYLSPFETAAALVMDGSGEAASTTILHAGPAGIREVRTIWFPHSLGYLYMGLTDYLGFAAGCDEGKVMGLASYGDASALPGLAELVRLDDRGYRLDLRWFDFHRNGASVSGGRPFFSEAFLRRFGPPRRPGEPLSDRHADMAAGVQAVLERAVLHLADLACDLTGESRLVLGGGVALNSVANGRLLEERPGIELFIPPPCGDDGTAMGAALLSHHDVPGRRRAAPLPSPFLGPGPDERAMEEAAVKSGLDFERPKDPVPAAARLLVAGEVVGWYQGRSEIGPRALGNRSILADARDAGMKDRLNEKVKHREPFRPFAPVVPAELYSDWFEGRPDRPYMLEVARVREDRREDIPAVTHVDGTARVQTVSRDTSPLLWRLLHEVGRLTGVPILVNTSYNVMGQPLVQTPEEAISCFAGTGIDSLFLGDLLFRKAGKETP